MKTLPALLGLLSFVGSVQTGGAENRSVPLILAQTPEVCTQVYQPVCGTDPSGKRVTYSNACFARVAKATNVTPGACSK
jgi:hypothetical protein